MAECVIAYGRVCCCWLLNVLFLTVDCVVADWGECCCWLRSVFQDTGSMRRVWRSGLQTCATDSSMRKPWTGSGRMTSSLCDPSSTSSSTRWPKMSRLGQCSFFLWGLGYFCLSSTLAFPSRAFTQVTHPHTLFIRLHLGGFTISLNCPGLLPWLGRAQELRESRGGCPGRGSLIVFNTVSADVKQHWTWAPDWACSTATLSSACRLANLVVGVFKVFAVPQEPPPPTPPPLPPCPSPLVLRQS